MTVHAASRRSASQTALASVLALALGITTTLAGCSDPETRNTIEKAKQDSRKGIDDATLPQIPAKHYNPLIVSDKVWTGNTATRMHRGAPLPPKFETDHGVTIVSSEPLALADIVSSLAQQTGIPFHLADMGARTASVTPAAPVLGGVTASTSGTSNSGNAMPVAYEGPLSGLLERVSGHFGVNWRYDGATISITRFETRVFAIEALPGKLKVSEGMQDDTSSSSSGSGSSGSSSGSSSSSATSSITQNSKIDIDLSYWEELEKVINSMLGGTGSAVVSPTLGTITVSTTPEVMRQIADFIAQENQRISRQIAINVEVYTVSLSEGLDFNIAFNTALRRLTNFGGNFAGGGAPTTVSGFTGGGSLSLAILNPNVIHTDGQTINPVGQVTDVFTALSGIGDTTKVAKFPLITLNNRPVARRVGKDVNYVASTTTNTTGSGTSSTFAGTSLTPGTVHQGFSVQLTPRLLDDGRILLQYSLSIIDVLSIDSFNSVTGSSTADTSSASAATAAAGSSTVQLPTTSNRIFIQQSVLKSGSTLIIGGAEEEDASQNSQGVGDAYNYALGGGISSGRTHTMVFFALTPQVLDSPHSEQE